jgi:arsenate reductase (thioredoxin)
MAEAGIDISQQRSRHIDGFADMPLDFVVTVCGHAHETCPVFPGRTKVVHVGLDDPPVLARDAKSEAEAMQHYRRVRDEIHEWIMTLPQSLSR